MIVNEKFPSLRIVSGFFFKISLFEIVQKNHDGNLFEKFPIEMHLVHQFQMIKRDLKEGAFSRILKYRFVEN